MIEMINSEKFNLTTSTPFDIISLSILNLMMHEAIVNKIFVLLIFILLPMVLFGNHLSLILDISTKLAN